MSKTILVVMLAVVLFFSACGDSDSSNCTDTNSTNTIQTGLKEDSLSGIYDFSDVFLSYRNDIRMLYPYQISTSYLDTEVKDRGYIKFIDKVPYDLSEELYRLGYEDNFILTGGGDISQRDSQFRTELVAKALSQLDYSDYSIGFLGSENIIEITMGVPNEDAFPNKEAIVDATLKQKDWSKLEGRASILKINDIKWKIIVSSEPIHILNNSEPNS